jgi:hypothetical protein
MKAIFRERHLESNVNSTAIQFPTFVDLFYSFLAFFWRIQVKPQEMLSDNEKLVSDGQFMLKIMLKLLYEGNLSAVTIVLSQ